MRGKLIILLCFLLVGSSLFSFQNLIAYASDDIEGITLEAEMRQMIDEGVLEGYEDGTYRPYIAVSRGQFATFISRALDLPEGISSFPDVPPTSKLAAGINSTCTAGIVSGYTNGNFGMNDPITRDEMAKIIDNALVYLEIDRTAASLTFTDVTDIGQTFQIAVANTVNDEIIQGIPNGNGTFKFLPKKTATRAESAAVISRMLDTVAESVKPEPEPEPEPEPVTYKLATIDANKNLVPGAESYGTYAEAKNAETDPNQVVIYGDKIINMSAGLVISTPPTGQYITYFYEDSNFTKNITYVNAQQEMEYIESTVDFVKVNLAGQSYYAKHSEVTLIPYQQAQGRNYYSVNKDGVLVHTLYNQITKAASAYEMGKAPSFLTPGNQYYSWDGGEFYNTAGVHVGTAYQYFNYLPARTVSEYTAEELDRYINYILAEREGYYTSNPTLFARYKDATQISKIKELGSYLKEAESKYKINALLILAMAMHESDFGMSSKAQEINNLFGIKVYDSNENAAEKYASPNEAIDALANFYLNPKYINPLGVYSNGAVTGNKSIGFNMKYASDPYWGQKIAGHMYRVDKFLGGKDLGKYEIGMTNIPDLNVRIQPMESILFTYEKADMPVVILGTTTQTNGAVWYKVISDDIDYSEAYIYSPYVDLMSIVK